MPFIKKQSLLQSSKAFECQTERSWGLILKQFVFVGVDRACIQNVKQQYEIIVIELIK